MDGKFYLYDEVYRSKSFSVLLQQIENLDPTKPELTIRWMKERISENPKEFIFYLAMVAISPPCDLPTKQKALEILKHMQKYFNLEELIAGPEKKDKEGMVFSVVISLENAINFIYKVNSGEEHTDTAILKLKACILGKNLVE